ncbi:HAD family hydrolase [Brevibacillus fortis]|uniref:HAD family hydrolase n=1 Tax=Brevibacillus fortis TaxID=2126352 RepID=A0A2P7VH28_9BACL|nr:NIF family HAD-type phosphatase [Brevibacillus fortis]PSJ98531.1 HAD family hydrolase [Brevibacillus fortis]
MAIIFDLDQTLIDSRAAEPYRMGKNRDLNKVYGMIPTLTPYPGINELIEECNQNNIRISIVTAGTIHYCKRVVEHWQWKIDHLVCFHDYAPLKKPHPKPIQMGVARLNKDTTDIIAIGDSSTDTEAARKAGVFSIGALWGTIDKQSLIASKPDLLCENVAELRNFIASKFF